MTYITNEIINEIRNKTDIVEIISNYLPLTKRGKNYFGVCPFHDDHSPSMSVSPDKQIYTCFSCGATGNVFTFVSDFEHISFYDAVILLGNKLGYNLESGNNQVKIKDTKEKDIYKLANKLYQNNLNTSLGKNALEYLYARKIDNEIIKKFDIGLSLNNKTQLTSFLESKKYKLEDLINLGLTNDYGNDIFLNRIIFPLYDLSGNVVGFSGRIYNTRDDSKYINSKETEIFKKSKLLYNYHRAREHLKKNKEVIVMEGFMDVIRASTIGIDNCVATMGTAFTKDHAQILKKMSDDIILCFDGDSAGEKATNATIKILEDIGINPKVVRLEENLDPDEYILKYGKEKFISKIEKAQNAIEYKMNLLKNNKNLTDVKDISTYIDQLLNELVKENDTILIELSLKKMAKEFDIEYESLKNRYDKYVNDNSKEQVIKIVSKKQNTIKDKYLQAQENILYYMLKSEDVIILASNKIDYMPEDRYRYLSNEIIYFYQKYGVFNLADFMSYIIDNEMAMNTLKEIMNLNLKDKYLDEEIEDYIYLINNYYIKSKITELENKIKQEANPIEQAKLLSEIIKLKGVKQ